MDLRKVGRRALESMIRVGALDDLGPRCGMIDAMDRIIAVSESHFRAKEVGQLTFFGGESGIKTEITLPDSGDISKKEQLDWEKELLGLYLSDHPLSDYLPYLKNRITHYSGQLEEAPDKSQVIVGGSVEEVRPIITKKGDEMAFVRLMDPQGEIELVVFPRVWKKYNGQLVLGEVVFAKGNLDLSRGDPKMLVNHIEVINLKKLSSIPHVNTAGQVAENGTTPAADPVMDVPWDDPQDTQYSTDTSIDESPPIVQNLPDPPKDIQEKQENYQPRIAPNEVRKGKKIEIILNSCGSKEKDTRKLKNVFGILTSIPGEDQFSFTCKENGKAYRIDFPNNKTSVSDALIQQISGMVGENNILVE